MVDTQELTTSHPIHHSAVAETIDVQVGLVRPVPTALPTQPFKAAAPPPFQRSERPVELPAPPPAARSRLTPPPTPTQPDPTTLLARPPVAWKPQSTLIAVGVLIAALVAVLRDPDPTLRRTPSPPLSLPAPGPALELDLRPPTVSAATGAPTAPVPTTNSRPPPRPGTPVERGSPSATPPVLTLQPGLLRLSSRHNVEVVAAGRTWTAAEARRGIELPVGPHTIQVVCLDCPPGTAALQRSVEIPAGGPLLLPDLQFP